MAVVDNLTFSITTVIISIIFTQPIKEIYFNDIITFCNHGNVPIRVLRSVNPLFNVSMTSELVIPNQKQYLMMLYMFKNASI